MNELSFVLLGCVGLSSKSAEVIVMTAFEAHRFKDVSRSQVASAIKSVCSTTARKGLRGADKATLTLPLAAALAAKNIVNIKGGADLGNLTRGDATKVGTI